MSRFSHSKYKRQPAGTYDRQKRSDRSVPHDELMFAAVLAGSHPEVHEARTVAGLVASGLTPNRKQVDRLYAAVSGEN